MDSIVTIVGVKSGVSVVNLIALVRRYTGQRLKESKQAVEKILEGYPVDFLVVDGSQVSAFASQSRELGAIVLGDTTCG